MSLRAASDAPAMDSYWRRHCDGFSVEVAGRRVGVVAELHRDASGEPISLSVLGGLFGNRRLEVPVDLIDDVVPSRSLLVLRRLPTEPREQRRRGRRDGETGLSLAIDVEDSHELARDLADALARRGLPSSTSAGDETSVAIRSREDARSLLPDLAAGVAAWLGDRGRDSVLVRAGNRRFRVRLAEHTDRAEL